MMSFNFTPKQLAYISISLATIVLIATICMIIFPKWIKKSDEYFAFKGEYNPWLLKIAYFLNYAITPLTVSLFYIIMAGILALNEEYKILWIGIFSIIIVAITFWSLKRITQRQRPKEALIHFNDYSFPSGHTSAWFVFFLSFALALTWTIDIKCYEFIFFLAILWWCLIAWSRRYIKVHWLTDVIIWAILWIWCFIFSYLLFLYFGDAIFQAIEHVFYSLK
jgi:membrane-associated phospholipid phosphatase